MRLNEQKSDKNSIVDIQETTVDLAHIRLKIPCFVNAEHHFEIGVSKLEDLDKATVFGFARDLKILIIGTGLKTRFLAPKQQVDLNRLGIGFETMENRAACRSFNLLLADGRAAGLLLLPCR